MSSDTQACEGKKYDNNKRALDLLHDVESGTVRYELARRISEALDQAEARGALVTDEIRNKWYQAGRKAALGEAENTAAADARVAELEAELRREVDTNNAINLQQQTATLANTRDVFRGSHVMTLFEKSEARVAELENHLHECQAFFSGGTADGEAYHLDIWRRTTDLLAKTRQIPSTPGPSNIYGHPVELRPAQTRQDSIGCLPPGSTSPAGPLLPEFCGKHGAIKRVKYCSKCAEQSEPENCPKCGLLSFARGSILECHNNACLWTWAPPKRPEKENSK